MSLEVLGASLGVRDAVWNQIMSLYSWNFHFFDKWGRNEQKKNFFGKQ